MASPEWKCTNKSCSRYDKIQARAFDALDFISCKYCDKPSLVRYIRNKHVLHVVSGRRTSRHL